jgi:polyisoprenyl-phosphate glycosyltransferase
MSASICKVSIVCPAYEEEEVLPCFHAELSAELAPLASEYEFEILYVDDGSRDQTLPILRRLAASDARVRYLSLSRNFGHQAALTAGLEHARGDVVISLDSDLQHPPAVIPLLLERYREGYDVVLTLREDDPGLSWTKRQTSALFYKVMRLLSDTEMRAAAADYRLLTRKVVDALLRLHETHRFLRGMVSWLGFPTATVSFAPAPRAAGVSKYTLRRMLGFALDALVSFSRLPVRLPLFAGLATCGVAGLLAGGALVRALFTNAATDWSWLILETTMLVMGGAVLATLGMVGEYIGRTYEQVKGRPLYVVKETSKSTVAALPFNAGSQDAAAA